MAFYHERDWDGRGYEGCVVGTTETGEGEPGTGNGELGGEQGNRWRGTGKPVSRIAGKPVG